MFKQTPQQHITSKYGCELCANENIGDKNSCTQDAFIEKCKGMYGGKYIYSDIVYHRSNDMINVMCPKHGYFTVKAVSFLQGLECQQCKKERYIKNKKIPYSEFLRRAIEAHRRNI